jgi:hypothetical protein
MRLSPSDTFGKRLHLARCLNKPVRNRNDVIPRSCSADRFGSSRLGGKDLVFCLQPDSGAFEAHTLRPHPSSTKADIQMATAWMDAQNKEDAATMSAEDAVFPPPELTISDRTAIEASLKKDRPAVASSKMNAMTLDHAHRVHDLDSWREICNVLTIKLHGWCDVRRASMTR